MYRSFVCSFICFVFTLANVYNITDKISLEQDNYHWVGQVHCFNLVLKFIITFDRSRVALLLSKTN